MDSCPRYHLNIMERKRVCVGCTSSQLLWVCTFGFRVLIWNCDAAADPGACDEIKTSPHYSMDFSGFTNHIGSCMYETQSTLYLKNKALLFLFLDNRSRIENSSDQDQFWLSRDLHRTILPDSIIKDRFEVSLCQSRTLEVFVSPDISSSL